jgi:hypothetical protein
MAYARHRLRHEHHEQELAWAIQARRHAARFADVVHEDSKDGQWYEAQRYSPARAFFFGLFLIRASFLAACGREVHFK